jgi:hypothetical protein
MLDETIKKKSMIVDTLKSKSVLKEKVYDNTSVAFMIIKDILKNLTKEVNTSLLGIDPRIRMEYTDRSNYDAQLRVAADMLLFSMHSNIFKITRHGKPPTSRRTSSMPTAASSTFTTSLPTHSDSRGLMILVILLPEYL